MSEKKLRGLLGLEQKLSGRQQPSLYRDVPGEFNSINQGLLNMLPMGGMTTGPKSIGGLSSAVQKARPYTRSGQGKRSREVPISETGKGYDEQAYQASIKVKVKFKDGQTIIDNIKGMNEGHALARAKSNWPGAAVIKINKKRGSGRDWPDVRLADRRERLAEKFLDEHGFEYSHIPGKPNTYTYVDGKIKAYSGSIKGGKSGVSVKTFNNPTLKSLRDWMGY